MFNLDILTNIFNYLTLKDRCYLGYCNKYLQKAFHYIKYDQITTLFPETADRIKKWKNFSFHLCLSSYLDKDIIASENVYSITATREYIEKLHPNTHTLSVKQFSHPSILINLRKLTISKNSALTNYDLRIISSNKNLEYLKLKQCPRITDVSMFGYLDKLQIQSCERIKNINFKGSIPKTLMLFRNPIENYFNLQNLDVLHISDKNIDKITFKNIGYLILEWCNKLKTIKELANIDKISVVSCYKLKNGLHKLHKCNARSEFSPIVDEYLSN
jgi:hypothetical protein